MVVFDFDDEKAKLFSEKRFAFYVKDKNHRYGNDDDGVLIQAYSQQEKKMVVNFVTYSGEAVIYRYSNKDRAFCLSENAQLVEDNLPSAESVCEGAANNDVCSYIIMVTRIKNAKVTKKQKIYCDGVDGIEVDGSLQTDGVDGLLQTDGVGRRNSTFGTASAYDGGISIFGTASAHGGGRRNSTFGTASAPSSSKINKYKYTNVMQGGETKQKFDEAKIRYEGAPITFYHVVFVSKNKEKR